MKAVQARVDKLLDTQFPSVKSQDQQQYKDQIESQVNKLLALVYALLSLSIIVSLFGIVNTLVLSIHERTRELGMMRAIGTSRRQVRRIVRYEAVITSLIGGLLGVALGLLLGAMTTVALSSEGFTLQIPVVTVIVFLVPRRSRACWPRSRPRGGRRASTCWSRSRTNSCPPRRPSLRADAFSDQLRGGTRARLAQ